LLLRSAAQTDTNNGRDPLPNDSARNFQPQSHQNKGGTQIGDPEAPGTKQ
jgi:hypothetical protein